MKTFQALDKNGDGVLSREELILGYSKNMGEQEAIEEVNRIMVEIDKNNSGQIDYSGNLILLMIRICCRINQQVLIDIIVEIRNSIQGNRFSNN